MMKFIRFFSLLVVLQGLAIISLISADAGLNFDITQDCSNQTIQVPPGWHGFVYSTKTDENTACQFSLAVEGGGALALPCMLGPVSNVAQLNSFQIIGTKLVTGVNGSSVATTPSQAVTNGTIYHIKMNQRLPFIIKYQAGQPAVESDYMKCFTELVDQFNLLQNDKNITRQMCSPQNTTSFSTNVSSSVPMTTATQPKTGLAATVQSTPDTSNYCHCRVKVTELRRMKGELYFDKTLPEINQDLLQARTTMLRYLSSNCNYKRSACKSVCLLRYDNAFGSRGVNSMDATLASAGGIKLGDHICNEIGFATSRNPLIYLMTDTFCSNDGRMYEDRIDHITTNMKCQNSPFGKGIAAAFGK